MRNLNELIYFNCDGVCGWEKTLGWAGNRKKGLRRELWKSGGLS